MLFPTTPSRGRRCLALLASIIVMSGVQAQNLVQNGSFESYSTLPTYFGQTDHCEDWDNVNGNYSGPPYGPPDYYHASGFNGNPLLPIAAVNGQAQMGFVTWHSTLPEFREYLSGHLSVPLTVGLPYEIGFFLSSGEAGSSYSYRSNNIGLHLSAGPLSQSISEPIDVEPQFELTQVQDLVGAWTYFSTTIVPMAEYDRITFGNFRTDAETSVTPGALGAYYFIDSVTVKLHGPTAVDEEGRPLIAPYPNPTSGPITVHHPADSEALQVIDAAGQLVLRFAPTARTTSIDLSALPAGCYGIVVRNPRGQRVHRVMKL